MLAQEIMMADDKQVGQVLVEVTIDTPIATVWRSVREPEQLANWFGWESAGLADEIDYIFFRHASVDEASHTIRFEPWEGIADGLELVERENATVLRIVRFGAPPVDWQAGYDEVNEGWVTFVQQLRLLLDRHPGERRRTLYLSGAANPNTAEPRVALGLEALRDIPEGEEFVLRLPTGEPIAGTIWHRTHFQTGLMVRQWGDGLLVVSNKGVGEHRPSGGGSVLITTFGMDEPSFAALEARWLGWWDDHYTQPT